MKTSSDFNIAGRKIGLDEPPFVIAEIGINHEGDFDKAIQMVDDVWESGCECAKFQSHVIEDEMIPNDVIPSNANESIWDIMSRCTFTEKQEVRLKKYVEQKGLIFLSTPFSRAAANRLDAMGVEAYKIGSGECNNYPLIKHIASFGKPIILSTGMNDISAIDISVSHIRKAKIPYALLHCTSMYPTPYDKVRLGGIEDLANNFNDAVIGLSDHSLGNYTSYAAIALGACIIEKHFTSNISWPGPDVPISITPQQLHELVAGTKAIHSALGGKKIILKDEQSTIDFAYACVVTTKTIKKGETFSEDNIWVKRPGTGEIKAIDYDNILGKVSAFELVKDVQLKRSDVR